MTATAYSYYPLAHPTLARCLRLSVLRRAGGGRCVTCAQNDCFYYCYYNYDYDYYYYYYLYYQY